MKLSSKQWHKLDVLKKTIATWAVSEYGNDYCTYAIQSQVGRWNSGAGYGEEVVAWYGFIAGGGRSSKCRSN